MLKTIKNLFRDLFLAIRHVLKARYLLDNNSGVTAHYPEREVARTGRIPTDRRDLAQQPVILGTIDDLSVRHRTFVENDKEGEQWFFVNGIMTGELLLKTNALELSKVFDRTIHPIHNPTKGKFRDLVESILGRTFNVKADISDQVTKRIVASLQKNDKVVLIGHSQGGIISSNVVKCIEKDHPELLSKLEVYTFGSAHDEFFTSMGNAAPVTGHFANGLDYVAAIGAIAFKKDVKGPLFQIKDRKGHLLNEHYLAGFREGHYCGKKSPLFKYINNK